MDEKEVEARPVMGTIFLVKAQISGKLVGISDVEIASVHS